MRVSCESKMISLKSHMDEWDGLRSRGQVSLDAYIRVLKALEASAAEMVGGEGVQFREDLRAILQYLDPQADPAVIEKSRQEAEKAIQALVEVINRREFEYKEIIRIIAEAGATMAHTGTAHGEDLRRAAAKVESIARLDSLVEARRQLSAHIEDLRGIAARVQSEGLAQAQRLKQELELAREHLRFAAALAETDPLTGLGNRRRAEAAVQRAIADQARVSVLLLDLDGFKAVNDGYGHAQGDKLLKSVAQHVRRCLRESDLVCRWGGDEFVVVMRDSPVEAAEATAERIRTQAFGEFVLGRAGENVQVQISASIGAAEYLPGESATELLERADRAMYAFKNRAKGAAR